MPDYLLQFCIDKDIELFYTNNSTPVLSSYVQYGIRNIVAYSVFRGCTKEVAAAIVSYYSQDKDKEIYIHRIKEFLKKYLESGTWKIDNIEIDLNEKTMKELNLEIKKDALEVIQPDKKQIQDGKTERKTQTNQKPRTPRKKQGEAAEKVEEVTKTKAKASQNKTKTSQKAKAQVKNNGIPEVVIKNMTKKSFKGDAAEVKSNESIRVAEDDVIELEITIDPFNT